MRAQRVKIAELKSRLSEYLRVVRKGHTLTVVDRETPIARLVPVEEGAGEITVRHPLPGAPKLSRVALPPPLLVKTDAVDLLLAERRV